MAVFEKFINANVRLSKGDFETVPTPDSFTFLKIRPDTKRLVAVANEIIVERFLIPEAYDDVRQEFEDVEGIVNVALFSLTNMDPAKVTEMFSRSGGAPDINTTAKLLTTAREVGRMANRMDISHSIVFGPSTPLPNRFSPTLRDN